MGRFAVDPELLQHIDAQLEASVADARSGLAALTGQMGLLLASGWCTPASRAFTADWRAWHAGATDLLEALEALGVAVGMSARRYAGTEAEVRASMAT